MKKFIFLIYFSVLLLTLFLSSIIFTYFNFNTLKISEKKEFLIDLNVIESLYDEVDLNTLNTMIHKFGMEICYDKDVNCKKFDFKDKEGIFFENGYIVSTKNYEQGKVYIYKKLPSNEVFFKNILFCIVTIVLVSIIIYFSLNKYIYKNIIVPIDEIIFNIININDKKKINTKSVYKFEELESLKNAILSLQNNIKNMGIKLKTEKTKIDYILDNMAEGFVLFDENKNVFSINKMAKKILNCYTKEAGENIVYYTKNIKILENIDKSLNKNQKTIFDFKTEENKTYSVYIDRIQKNSTNNIVMLMIDVTEKRENEKLKQEFFSNVSHELKTPITSIQGYAELLYNDFAISKEQEKEFLKRIQKESSNITSLIDNILTISKLESKEIDISTISINIRNIVEDIINTVEPMCIEREIQIYNKCENIYINADYKKIYQLFNNLIVNAINYNKNKGFVEINCFQTEKNIVISVKDSGIGIPLVDRNRIFERFYRVEKGRSKNQGGTGLGLSIVKHVVKYYNGKIKLKSTEDFGSEFIIKFPITMQKSDF